VVSTNKTEALCKFVMRQLGAGRALSEEQRQQILAAGIDVDRLVAESGHGIVVLGKEAGLSSAPESCAAPESSAEEASHSTKRQRLAGGSVGDAVGQAVGDAVGLNVGDGGS